METVIVGRSLPPQPPCAATIGFFDGVHRGHAFLIGHVVGEARRRSLQAAVITFSEHPRRVLHSDYQPQLLTTNDEKARLLAATGIQRLAILPFTREMAGLSAKRFMREVLGETLNVRLLYIGYDNRFGHNREEGFADYEAYGRELGIGVRLAPALTTGGTGISSSVVRSLIASGNVSGAASCLGRPYVLSGTVVCGVQIGRRIGFPTANLHPLSAEKIVPARGVYAVRALISGETTARPAIMNIGTRPTFDDGDISMEIHIFGFGENIYGRTIDVSFIQRIREERRFATPGLLVEQIAADKAIAEKILTDDCDNRS